MDLFVAFKYLHIVSMFFAVGLALSSEIVMRQVANSHDVRAIRITLDRVKPLGNLSTGLFMAGAAFGIVAALTGQIDLLAPWLILAYAAFIGAVLLGVFIADPWVARLDAASAASPEDSASDELRAVIADPRARSATAILMGLLAVLVFSMVVKPFG